jgi:hypothetical protein
MKLNNIRESVYFKNLNYKVNLINKKLFIENIGNFITEKINSINSSQEDMWLNRSIHFNKCFFHEDTPKSISLDTILDFVKDNKNSKLIDYLNYLPGIEKNKDGTFKDLKEVSYQNHGFLVMNLNRIDLFNDYFIVKDFIDKNKIDKFVKNGFIIESTNLNTKFFYNGYSWVIENYLNSYTFKNREFEIYLNDKDLQDKPVEFVKLYFH